MSKHKNSSGRIALGVIFVLLGLIFIADNFYLFHYDLSYYIFQWETIVIVIGLIILANNRRSFGGYFLVAIGGLSLLGDEYNFTVWEFLSDFWPVLLILLGIAVIFRRDDKRKANESEHCCFHGHEKKHTDVNDDYIDSTVVFGGKKLFIKSQNFSGGKTTTVFGGLEIDFTEANLAPGKNIIDTFTVFGGTELFIPKEWSVAVNVISVFGGIDDKRTVAGEIPPSENSIVIKGLVIFGGVEIKYY